MTGTLDYRRRFMGIAVAIAASIWFFNAGPGRGPDIREVDVQAAKAMLEQGAIVIDVRGAEAFAANHIAGAVLMPLDQLRAAIPSSLAAAKAQRIVVYCGDGARSGPEGTSILNQAGFSNAVNLKGGIEGWKKAGMPIAKGPS